MTKSGKNPSHQDGIAIIGMSARFPGAKNVEEFWQNLRNGVESVVFFSDEELLDAGISQAMLNNPNYVKAGMPLKDIDLFDASLFGYSPREAEIMDPQHRLFLECAWEALESSGYDSERYKGLIGVFAGVSMSSYFLRNLRDNREAKGSVGGYQVMMSNDKDHLATRVSYKLNLKGPSISVQTTCSTSLVAVHLACQNLLNYQCDIALAGGVSIKVPQNTGYLYQEGGIASPDGHCRAFDADARGTVTGSGLAIVVLKRLSDSLSHSDIIHALITGSAINNDGSVKVGYTAPSLEGQARVIAMAQAVAGLSPDSISYIEAHGTATPLGDPVEIAALSKVFRARSSRKQFCAIGSVKTNVGHLDAAAGVTGLIKTALSLKHGLIPPSLHYRRANPKMKLDESPFYVNTELRKWEQREGPRRAGVSSFGIGGTNAHVIVEQAPEGQASGESRRWQLVVLSANSEQALEEMSARMVSYLRGGRGEKLADVAYTLSVGRREMKARRIVVCREAEECAAMLEAGDSRQVITGKRKGGSETAVAMMFGGQGSQYVNMGRELYERESRYRREVDELAEMMKQETGRDIREVIYPEEGREAEASEELNRTEITQPALYVVEMAMAKMWMGWGVKPEALIGHSLGEMVAATLSGVMSEEEGVRLVAARGRVMSKARRGGMVAVGMSEEEAELLIEEEGKWKGIEVGAVNGRKAVVLSGEEEEVEEVEREVRSRGISSKRLEVRVGFHSKMMEEVAEEYEEEVRKVKLREPKIRYVSNVTGKWARGEEVKEAKYWVRQMRERVRIMEGMREVGGVAKVMLEVGPGQVMSQIARREIEGVVVVSSMGERGMRGEEEKVVKGLGKMWAEGVRVEWERYYEEERRKRVELPTYAFQRKRFWIDPKKKTQEAIGAETSLRRKANIAEWFYVPSWKRTLLAGTLNNRESNEIKRWLVMSDELGLGLHISGLLEQAGHQVVQAKTGEEYTKLSDGEYLINPKHRSEYELLLSDLQRNERTPDAIIHLWSIKRARKQEEAESCFQQSQDLGFNSLVYLAQALRERDIRNSINLYVVTDEVQEVTGEEEIRPDAVTILGPCKVIPQEYKNIICRSIDVSAAGKTEGQKRRIAGQIVSETREGIQDISVAYRREHRWTQAFEPVRWTGDGKGKERFREGGVYLITGWGQGLGAEIAQYLIERAKARLVLLERAGRGRGQSEEKARASLKKIQASGGEVLALEADLTDTQQLKNVIAEAQEHFGALHGVIHSATSAGEDSFASIPETNPVECNRLFRQRLDELTALEEAFSGIDIDLCLVQSSLSSFLGGSFEAAHSAASLLTDAYVYSHSRSSPVPWTSINWDSWESGDGAIVESGNGRMSDDTNIKLQEGAKVFELIPCLAKVPQVLVSPRDIQARINLWTSSRSQLLKLDAKEQKTESPQSIPAVKGGYAAPRNQVEEIIAAMWRDLLGVENPGIHDDFFELGGHSLVAIQLIFRLREVFKSEDLHLNSLFEAPTIAGLAEAIDRVSMTKPTLSPILVPIRSGGSKPPFFCVHPIGGDVFGMRGLASRMPPDRPFYGIQSVGLAEIGQQGDQFKRLEDMAAYYIKAIYSVQTEGPYLLGGLSYGGVVAFEMAQQLTLKGQKVALLALIDTPSPDNIAKVSDLDDSILLLGLARERGRQLRKPIQLQTEDLMRLETDKRMPFIIEKLKETRLAPDDLSTTWMDSFIKGFRARINTTVNYVPQVYPGKITLFKANVRDTELSAHIDKVMDFEDHTLGWSSVSSQPVEVHVIPGYHETIAGTPLMAERLRACIERIEEIYES